MPNKPTLESLVIKFKDVPKSDFIIAKIAAKLDAFEVILVERLYSDADARRRAFAQLDSDCLSLMETYLEMMHPHKDSGSASGQSDDQSLANN